MAKTSSPDIRWKQRFQNYQNALSRFKEALDRNSDDRLIQEGVIQRFEFTFELGWKLLQDLLIERGFGDEARGPRPSIELAFSNGIIQDGPAWMSLLKSRNESTHLYDEKIFNQVYKVVTTNALAGFKELEKYCLTLK